MKNTTKYRVIARSEATRQSGRTNRVASSVLPPRNDFVIFLVGPTAIGKSEIALRVAKKIGGEIVSCDSMQVYRGMDVGTAKPTKAQQKRVRHHLIDILPIKKTFHVAGYRRLAMRAIREIIARKKVPVVVGGTGLYFRALLDGLFQGPGANKEVRERLERQAQSKGSAWLHRRLVKLDPRAARNIHPNNTRKLIRALEVYAIAGRPISELQGQWGRDRARAFPYPFRAFGLEMSRPDLYQQVDKRVQRMFRTGLRGEVEDLLKRGLKKNAVACQAIGYKEVIGWLEGHYDRGRAVELVQRNSRRFAKRQFTWFKKDARIQWIGVAPKGRSGQALRDILREIGVRHQLKKGTVQ